jgi:hypothetical protein
MSTTPPTKRPPSLALAALGTLAHAGLVLVLFVLYVSVVPSAKKTFDEFGVQLPWLSLSVIRVSNWVCEYWWMLAPVVLGFGVADFGLLAALSTRSQGVALLGLVFVTLMLTSLIAVTTVALEIPKAKIKEGLSR